MRLSRFKFNTISIIEIIIIIIIVPWALSEWTTGVSNMKYSSNFYTSLKYESAQVSSLKINHMEKAEEAKPDEFTINMYKANYLINQNNIDKALIIYNEQLEEVFDDIGIPKAGQSICKLRKIDKEEHKGLKSSKLISLEKDVKKFIQEEPDYADMYVILGNIYIKMAQIQKEKKNFEHEYRYMNLALSALERIKRRNKDFGKNRKQKWIPMSEENLHSFYLAHAKISYWMSRYFEKSSGINPEEKAREYVKHLFNCIKSLSAIFTLRIEDPNAVQTAAYLFRELLTFPYISKRRRQEFNFQAISFIENIRVFNIHLSQTSSENKSKTWNTRNISSHIYYGLGVSYYYLNDQKECLKNLNRAISIYTKEQGYYKSKKAQIQMLFAEKIYYSHGVLKAFKTLAEKKYYTKKMQKYIIKINKGERLIPEEFIVVNHAIINNSVMKDPNLRKLVKYKNYYEKMLLNPPKGLYILQKKRTPVTSRAIIRHNIFRLFQIINKQEARKYSQYRIKRN